MISQSGDVTLTRPSRVLRHGREVAVEVGKELAAIIERIRGGQVRRILTTDVGLDIDEARKEL